MGPPLILHNLAILSLWLLPSFLPILEFGIGNEQAVHGLCITIMDDIPEELFPARCRFPLGTCDIVIADCLL